MLILIKSYKNRPTIFHSIVGVKKFFKEKIIEMVNVFYFKYDKI